jgi:molybdate transport system permease protein
MILADCQWAPPGELYTALKDPNIQHAIVLTLVTCTVSATLALLVAVPCGYLLARGRFAGKRLLDVVLDIPIVLPPLVVGISLLILFSTRLGNALHVTYTVTAVVLAQFSVGAAFSIRVMRSTFEHLPSRPEEVALTLGCSRGQAVWLVTIPAASRGMISAYTLAWARSMGEFGPILVFAGATRMRTEVLPTTVFLELSVGNLTAAIAVSLLMIAMALTVLLVVRRWGEGGHA